MSDQITISIWLFLLLAAIVALAVLDRILIPSTRWFLRRRINRVLDEIGTRLDIEIRPFQLTKRQVLIDRLAYDPKVVEEIQEYARQHEMPHRDSGGEASEASRASGPRCGCGAGRRGRHMRGRVPQDRARAALGHRLGHAGHDAG